MPNAYAISEPTQEQLRKEGKNVVGDSNDKDTQKQATRASTTEKTEVSDRAVLVGAVNE